MQSSNPIKWQMYLAEWNYSYQIISNIAVDIYTLTTNIIMTLLQQTISTSVNFYSLLLYSPVKMITWDNDIMWRKLAYDMLVSNVCTIQVGRVITKPQVLSLLKQLCIITFMVETWTTIRCLVHNNQCVGANSAMLTD